jgi:uncharacterized membrane protein YfcA
MMSSTFAFLLLFIFLGFTTQTVAGFGAMVIALTLGLQVGERAELLVLLVPVSVIQGTAIVARHHKDVDWRLLLRAILPIMGLGAIGGVAIAEQIDGPLLKRAFGVMVMVFASRELWRLRPSAKDAAAAPLAKPLAGGFILGAGVTQGIYACGGPLLVYVVGRLGLAKAAFRASMTAVFLILNIGLTAWFVIDGQFTTSHLPRLGATVPVLVVCLVLGEWIHNRIDERRFKIGVYTLLFLAGSTLLL